MTMDDDSLPRDEAVPGEDRPEWQVYELLIAHMMAQEVSTDLCVTANARVRGRISGAVRQVDVLIDSRHDTDNGRRIIVDAKKRRRRIDVKAVEEFEGFMKDVGATHGYLVSPAGHSEAAERRAQEAITISIVPLEHIKEIDPSTWPRCSGSSCGFGRVFWDGYPELSMLLRPAADSEAEPLRLTWLHYVGKCDRCGRFHVHCKTCGDLLSFDDEAGEHQCGCKMPWFWLASVEQDEHGETSAELHWVTAGKMATFDRRPFTKRQR
jgi:hypothetical protein